MKRLKKRSVKGMTLIEIIISILVLGITGTLMCVIGQTACKIMMDTNHLNNKTNVEAPVAIAQDANGVTAAPATISQIKISTSNGGFADRSVPCTSVERYTTRELADEDNDGVIDAKYDTNMDGNIVFYKINQ